MCPDVFNLSLFESVWLNKTQFDSDSIKLNSFWFHLTLLTYFLHLLTHFDSTNLNLIYLIQIDSIWLKTIQIVYFSTRFFWEYLLVYHCIIQLVTKQKPDWQIAWRHKVAETWKNVAYSICLAAEQIFCLLCSVISQNRIWAANWFFKYDTWWDFQIILWSLKAQIRGSNIKLTILLQGDPTRFALFKIMF